MLKAQRIVDFGVFVTSWFIYLTYLIQTLVVIKALNFPFE